MDVTPEVRNEASVYIDPLFFPARWKSTVIIDSKVHFIYLQYFRRRSLKIVVRARLLGVIVYVVRLLMGGNHFHFKYVSVLENRMNTACYMLARAWLNKVS